MADKTIEVKVTESGLSEVKRKAEAVNKELDKVEQPRVVKSATRTGSRAADAALGVSDTGLMRGSSGAGGRGGERDFARQAQGLGGLVHLYATFAANIYAVGAAFSALQKAADFERMEQASSKMSAVLGINLKAAANNMVLLTDGAVSFSDAIEKTNLAASAGLSTKQIEALTKVAKGASTALGRDMGDSLNRLVKGTVKLEPELLDELGILTKASEAYNKYALSMGKSADELTKFEKTQAFVNAVIEEGNTKFSSIYGTIEENPYTKLLASLQNLEKQSLSFLNAALKPIVNLLAESPVGLSAAIALVVGKLAKLAMPELLAGLATRVERASSALESSSQKFKVANEAVFKSFEQTVGYATISSNSKSKILKEASALRKQLNDSILTDFELTPPGQQVKYSTSTSKLIEDYEKKLTNYKNRLEGRGDLGVKSTRDLAAVKQELLLLQDMKKSYADLANNEQIAGVARNKENKATLDLLRANRALKVTELVMDGEHITALKVSYALEAQITREKIAQSKILSKIPGAGAVGGAVGGVIGAAGTAAMSIASKLSGIATAVAVGAALYEGAKWALGEAKSMKDLDAAVEGATDSHALLAERLATINKLMQAATDSSDAYAKSQQLIGTSMNEASNTIKAVFESYRKVQAEMYGENAPRALFSRASEIVMTMFGADSLTSSAKAISNSLIDTLATTTAEDSPKLRQALADALKIDVKDLDNIDTATNAIRNLLTVGDVVGLNNITNIINRLGNASLSSASQINSIVAAVAEANKEAKGIETKATLKNVKYSSLYEGAIEVTKATGKQQQEAGQALFSNIDVPLREGLSKANPVLNKFFKDAGNNKDFKNVAGFANALKELPGAIAKLPGKGDVSPDMSFPKDRLRAEKAYVETLRVQLHMLEKQQELNDLDVNIAEQRLGLAGEVYDSLLMTQYAQGWAIEGQKYLNSLKEAELKKDEAILAIKNDKNTLDKEASIADVNKQYEKQVKLIELGWVATAKRKEDELVILKLKSIQAKYDLASARAAMAASGAGLAKTGGAFGVSAKYTRMQITALTEQYGIAADKAKVEKEAAGDQYMNSAKYIDALTQQLDLAQKIYDAKRLATEEELKAFELAQSSTGIAGFLGNVANEFGYQISEALRNAKSATSVLVNGIITGIDSSIDKLFEGIQQGNLNLQDLANFASNAMSDAFRDAAAQSLKNGWKGIMEQFFPSLNDPLKVALDDNRLAIQANTDALLGKSSIGAGSDTTPKDLKTWGADVGLDTGTQTGDNALEKAGEKQVDAAKDNSNAGKTFLKASDTMFLAGAAMMAFQGKWEQAAFMFLAQLATTLTTMAATGGQSGGGILGTIFKGVVGAFTGSTGGEVLGPVINENAKGGIMTEYGPLRLEKYARGGIATRPQLALYGEGSTNEAYVPLPDNRTIPVTLNGASGSTVTVGDTNITVNVDSNGNAQVDSMSNTEMAKSLSMAIKRTVQEELMNQVRPGGMFYGKK